MQPEEPIIPEIKSETRHFEPPRPVPTPQLPDHIEDVRPVPVVKVLSPVGVEYVFLTFSLFVTAIALVGTLLSLVNGQTSFDVLAFPVATLVVGLPVFAGLFLHLKKLELQTPSLRLDASKRRSTQFTQIVSFVVSLLTLISFVFAVFTKLGGESELSIGKVALNCLCILVVSGGMLAYYWHDEHKTRRQG